MLKITALLAALTLACCTNFNSAGQRTVGGGLLGAGAGAVGGSMLGLDPVTSGLVGGAAGAGLGYITTPQGRQYYRR